MSEAPRRVGARPENSKAKWQRVKSDPIRLARWREYRRIYSDGQRRAAGAKETPWAGPKVRLIATENGAARLYYKRGKNGRLTVHSKRRIVDPVLVGVESQDSS